MFNPCILPFSSFPSARFLLYYPTISPPRWVLPTIVFAQFACTSLWFAGDAAQSLGGTGAIFGNLLFQQAALDFFGHMWELYISWAFVPLLLVFGPVLGLLATRWDMAGGELSA